MWANLGLKLVQADPGATVVEGEVNMEAHGGRDGATIHRGVVATVADCALACAAASSVAGGQAAATVDLRVEFVRAAQPGPIAATAQVRDRVSDLVFCDAIVRQGDVTIAHANGTIAVTATT